MIARSNVDLPQPLGPITDTKLPASMEQEISPRTWTRRSFTITLFESISSVIRFDISRVPKGASPTRQLRLQSHKPPVAEFTKESDRRHSHKHIVWAGKVSGIPNEPSKSARRRDYFAGDQQSPRQCEGNAHARKDCGQCAREQYAPQQSTIVFVQCERHFYEHFVAGADA